MKGPYTRVMEHHAAGLMEALVRHGYLVILLIMIVEEAGVPSPIPGDGLLLFAGYLSSTGRLTLAKSLTTIVLGALIGATILYWVARLGGRALVHRYGRFIGLGDRKLDQLRHLFERLGRFGPGLARLVPGLRIYASALAGLADIPYPVFLLNVLWAGIVWSLVFLLLGYYFGIHWREYFRVSERATVLTLLLIAVAVGGYVLLHRRAGRERS
jgi:membrane protein DedA with SNARE-associated domain